MPDDAGLLSVGGGDMFERNRLLVSQYTRGRESGGDRNGSLKNTLRVFLYCLIAGLSESSLCVTRMKRGSRSTLIGQAVDQLISRRITWTYTHSHSYHMIPSMVPDMRAVCWKSRQKLLVGLRAERRCRGAVLDLTNKSPITNHCN